MSEPITSNYWLDIIVDQAQSAYPTGEILVSSGISPSASYHIGHFREALTADAIAWGLRRAGRRARHLHVVDNFDPLRKRYEFLPERFSDFVGWPICLVPDPFDCHSSYATHYTEEFKASASRMGVEMDVIYSYEDQYLTGKMAPYIEQALEHTDDIREIFDRVAHRELAEDWVPIQILSDKNSFNEWRYEGIDPDRRIISYRTADGGRGEVPYDNGRVKLNWRLDWPARWALHGVKVEPFGKEHSTRGGSYDTGKEFASKVYGIEPPLPLAYDTINLLGDTKKMSSSLGNLITPAEALEIMPPEILRFFVLRSLPKRVLYFDAGLGLYNLVDEYSKIEEAFKSGGSHDFEQAYNVASAISDVSTITAIPFSHLVAVLQAARGDVTRAIEVLERTGYAAVVASDRDEVIREFAYVANWLAKYAPASVKFAVQDSVPDLELTGPEEQFLGELAKTLERQPEDADAQAIHECIYASAEASSVKPAEAFCAIYRVVLGQGSGPKAGWFLASLDRAWLVKRLRREA